MKKTILFGGSGFMGPHILAKDPDIISVGRTKPPTWVKNKHVHLELDDLSPLDNIEFDKVIFLIGNSQHDQIKAKIIDPIEKNVTPLINILDYLKDKKIKQFLAFSTILLYDAKKLKLPVSENQPLDQSVNKYVRSKFIAEQICDYYREFMNIINIRMSNVYGPIMLERNDLVPKMVKSIITNGSCEIWNDKPIRDFIHVYDAADAFLKLLKTDFSGTVNMGTGISRPVSDIVKILENVSGKKIKVLNKPVEGHKEFQCDMSLLKSLIDWSPKYDLESGLKETYETMEKWVGGNG